MDNNKLYSETNNVCPPLYAPSWAWIAVASVSFGFQKLLCLVGLNILNCAEPQMVPQYDDVWKELKRILL